MEHIEWGFHGDPALKKHYKTKTILKRHLVLQQDIESKSAFYTTTKKDKCAQYLYGG